MTYVQYVEIYNEAVFDLLASERTQVEVREDVVCNTCFKFCMHNIVTIAFWTTL